MDRWTGRGYGLGRGEVGLWLAFWKGWRKLELYFEFLCWERLRSPLEWDYGVSLKSQDIAGLFCCGFVVCCTKYPKQNACIRSELHHDKTLQPPYDSYLDSNVSSAT